MKDLLTAIAGAVSFGGTDPYIAELSAPPSENETLKVIEGVDFSDGQLNTPMPVLLDQIRAAIRRGHTQLRPEPPKPDAIALVGSGPSLALTERALRDVVHAGAKIVALNGAYTWCLDRNFCPSAQVILDARASSAGFLTEPRPHCRYFLASQCHPAVWDAVEGREHVVIYHSANPASEEAPILDGYYGRGRWVGVGGGTTVATRAIALLRMIGYFRFDLFGIDSCWLEGAHHAFAQPQNAHDRQIRVTVAPTAAPTQTRAFVCAPWHLKQIEDFLQFVRLNGDQVLLRAHGPGLLAHILTASADVAITKE